MSLIFSKRIFRLLAGFALLAVLSLKASAQKQIDDVITFGQSGSEKNHALTLLNSQIIEGGLKQSARILMPLKPLSYEGGKLAFNMSVDPVLQNYFTVKFWGSDRDKSMIMLFAEGKQVGYRHLGDIDLLYLGNGAPPFNGRFFYVTLPLPLSLTKGKRRINLELRSYGEIWGYGSSLETYQKQMSQPSLGFYKAYTHTTGMLDIPKDELQGSADPVPARRKSPGIEMLDSLKLRVNEELKNILALERPVNQHEIMFLAPAYNVKWSFAYKKTQVIEKVIAGMDEHYRKFLKAPNIIYTDPNIYNGDWLVTGPIGRAIRQLWPQISPELDKTFEDGSGKMISHRRAWSVLMNEAIKYSTTHRRQYTNQSMIIDMFIYDCNEALRLLSPDLALPKSKTLNYLYESVGLSPWLGKETKNGPEKNLGEHYMQLTSKGLTKELGFVGYYGEVLDWVVDIYKATEENYRPGTGDSQIRRQLLKMMNARSYFRYPSLDDDGFKAMRAEAVIGWRDGGHYPGDVLYGDRGMAWDATPLMTAATTLDHKAIAIAQQMLDENQFFKMVSDKMKLKGIRVTKSLLDIPEQYELIKKQPRENFKLPMADGMADFVFSDEEDGVVAIKNGFDRLYVSLYWRARNAVNKLAKVHYITPTIDRLANIYTGSEFEDSGMTYVRKNWVNLGFDGGREWYKGLESAHTGEILPVAKIPADVNFKQGDENVYAGKAQLYLMQYGHYFIAMNTTLNKEMTFEVPFSFRNAKFLSGQKKTNSEQKMIIKPNSTIVLYYK